MPTLPQALPIGEDVAVEHLPNDILRIPSEIHSGTVYARCRRSTLISFTLARWAHVTL